MKIQTLQLHNFRCFSDRTFTFDSPRALIAGDHEVGKSTTQDAIRWVLTGRCRGLDAGGRGVKELVKSDSTEMTVTANVRHNDLNRTVTRGYDGQRTTLDVEGFTGSAGDQQAALCEWLGVSQDILVAVLDGEWFLGLAHTEAKALMMTLLDVQIELPAEVSATKERITLAQLEKRYEAVYDERRILTRTIKDLGKALAEPPELVGDLRAVQARISDLRKERESLIGKRGEAHGQRAILEQELVKLRAEETSLTSELQTKEAFDYDILVANAETDATAATARATSAREAYNQAKEATGALDRDEQQRLIAVLEGHTPKDGCVLHRDVPCLTKAAEFKKAAQAIAGQTSMFSALDEARALVDAEEQKARDANAKVANLTRTRDTIVRLKQNLEETRTRIDVVKGQIPADVSPNATLNDEIAKMDDRIAKGVGIEQHKLELQAQWQRYEADKAKRTHLQQEYKKADLLVSTLGPNGIRVGALASAIDQFEASINTELQPFGYELKLCVEPWQALVNGRPIELLSTSARWRVCVALQMALAMMTPVKATLIDQVELLLSAPRKILTTLVLESPLEQVILAKAHEPMASAPNLPGVQTMLLVKDAAAELAPA